MHEVIDDPASIYDKNEIYRKYFYPTGLLEILCYFSLEVGCHAILFSTQQLKLKKNR